LSNFKLVPEIYCSDIEATKNFYVNAFGFEIKYERQEEQFSYFTLNGVDIMAEEISDERRGWVTGDMEKPFGRGVNFQWDVAEIDKMYLRIKAMVPDSIYLEMETKSYKCGDQIAVQKQFIVQDPDGYLFRFCCESKNNRHSNK